MKISIVTISYNQARYLQDCIDSVAVQKGDWEHIIVDPGSTDGSRELIEANRHHFAHIIFERDAGPADGLNKGFSRATGEIGFFLNSDDFLVSDALNKLTSLWDESPECELMLCAAWRVNGDGHPLKLMRPKSVSPFLLAQGRTTIVQQGMAFRMQLFKKIGGFNPANRTCWDGELLYAMMEIEPNVRLSFETIGAFRIHNESLTGGAAGVAHGKRYETDSKRIREAYCAPRYRRHSLENKTLSMISECFANRARYLQMGLDRLIPKRIEFLWKRDKA